jgi:ammonium transporter, Amt family
MSIWQKLRPWLPVAAIATALFAFPAMGLAEEAATATTQAAAPLKPAAPVVIDSGSTAWLLISSALVLLMVPGLALFYGGMVRAKSVLNTFLNVMVCCGVMGLIWVIIGYALVFPVVDTSTADGEGGFTNDGSGALITYGESTVGEPAVKRTMSILGFDPGLVFLKKFGSPAVVEEDPVSKEMVTTTNAGWNTIVYSGDTDPRVAKETGVPELVFIMFQGMFFIITPALIVGSIAERVRFGPLLLFLSIWSVVVYAPIAHMVWNVNGVLFQWGVMDFAGGTVVHVLAGVSALAICIVVGPRKGFGTRAMPPHSLGLTLIGAGLLWFGWFGFNAGSAIAIPGGEHPVSGGVAALAFTNTQIAAAGAAVAWMLVEWLKDGKPTILGFASGMVAGLVVITPCAGHVAPTSSIIIGLLGGAVCYFGCQLKKVFKYDDTLDAFGVHGVGGALGAVLVGIFAVRPAAGSFMLQLQGVLIAAVFAFVVSFVLAYAIKATIGLRSSEEDEELGLDQAAHGESGYNLSTTN